MSNLLDHNDSHVKVCDICRLVTDRPGHNSRYGWFYSPNCIKTVSPFEYHVWMGVRGYYWPVVKMEEV